jgi:hypothetical protein
VKGAGVGGMAGVDRAIVLSSSSSSMAIASSLDVPAVSWPFPLDGPDSTVGDCDGKFKASCTLIIL